MSWVVARQVWQSSCLTFLYVCVISELSSLPWLLQHTEALIKTCHFHLCFFIFLWWRRCWFLFPLSDTGPKAQVVVEWSPRVPVYLREHRESCQTSRSAPLCLLLPPTDPRTAAGQTLSGKPPAAQESAPSLLRKQCHRHLIRSDTKSDLFFTTVL